LFFSGADGAAAGKLILTLHGIASEAGAICDIP